MHFCLPLRVSTELRYRKQPWGLVKGFIEKNFWSGLAENFRHLGKLECCLLLLEYVVTCFVEMLAAFKERGDGNENN